MKKWVQEIQNQKKNREYELVEPDLGLISTGSLLQWHVIRKLRIGQRS